MTYHMVRSNKDDHEGFPHPTPAFTEQRKYQNQ
jgi:hypothetical protein